MLAHLPNALSIARLALVPVTIWLILSGNLLGAFWVFVAAGLTDALDGFIAKHFNAASEFGAYLDPIADKALLVSVFVALTAEKELPLWITLLVVFRDLLIIGGAVIIHTVTQQLRMEPLAISKLKTFAQIALVAWVLSKAALGIEEPVAFQALLVITAVTTFMSGVAYVVTWLKRVRHWEGKR